MAMLPTEAIRPSEAEQAYFRKVFAWMGIALAVSGGIAAVIGHSQRAMNALLHGSGQDIGLVGLVQHMGVVEAAACFLAYAALNGFTISIIFAAYTTDSIYTTFFVTAA